MRLQESAHYSVCTAAVRLFGSYDKALKAAGFDIEKIRPKPDPKYGEKDRKHLIKEAKRIALIRNDDSRDKAVQKMRTEMEDVASYFYGARCWGHVADDACIELASIQPLKRKYRTRQDVLAEIRRRHRCGRGVNFEAVYRQDRDWALYHRALELFGTWEQAVKRGGLHVRKVKGKMCGGVERKRSKDGHGG
jgi:hypothetical protein